MLRYLPYSLRGRVKANEQWRPSVTVAAIVEKDNRFLLVEEETNAGVRLNQPAGHWEDNETLLDAVVRETLEEAAYRVEPTELIGVYRWRRDERTATYLRFAFAASAVEHYPERALDTGILRALWLTRDEIAARRAQHRSPLVEACIDDFLAGRRYPLTILRHFG